MSNDSDYPLRIENLTKRYTNGDDVIAVDGLDLRLKRGEVFGFLGPNGAGKSTTINVVLDFIRPTAGTATIFGYDAQADVLPIRNEIGVLPERLSLYDRLTGREQLQFAIDSKDADETPAKLRDRVGLDSDAADRPVGQYSKGMRQRLALGMALAGNPRLLILDEPYSGLDPNGIRQLQRLIRDEAAAGTTVFFSSHILQHVDAICDRIGIIRNGSLLAVDRADELRESVEIGSRIEMMVSRAPDVSLTDIDGVETASIGEDRIAVNCSDPSAKAKAIAAVVERVAVRDTVIEEPTLEDVFASYTDADTEDTATTASEPKSQP